MKQDDECVSFLLFYCFVFIYSMLGLSCPVFPIQVAVTDGFCQMTGLYLRASVQVGNSTSYFQDAVVCAGRQVEACHGVP